jgi:hypothetical protein
MLPKTFPKYQRISQVTYFVFELDHCPLNRRFCYRAQNAS